MLEVTHLISIGLESAEHFMPYEKLRKLPIRNVLKPCTYKIHSTNITCIRYTWSVNRNNYFSFLNCLRC